MPVKNGSATKLEGPMGEFNGDIKVDDKLPTQKELANAGEVEVFDKEKRGYRFKELYTNKDGAKKRYLVIFIRHFFCGNCQEYVRTLSRLLPPSSFPKDTSAIIIGCGSPNLIETYATSSECIYPIYADPSRKLYQLLRMTRTMDLGKRSPQYLEKAPIPKLVVRSIWQGLRAGRQALSGGDFWQVGGEFIFDFDGRDLEATWCRRMRNTRDHAEVAEIKKELGMAEGNGSVERKSKREAAPTPEKKKRWSSITSSSGIGRRLSKRNPRASWHPATNGSAVPSNGKATNSSTLTNGIAEKPASPSAKETKQERDVHAQLKEESEPRGTGTEDALAKLSGAPNATSVANGKPIGEKEKVMESTILESKAPNGAPVELQPVSGTASGVTTQDDADSGTASEGVGNGAILEEKEITASKDNDAALSLPAPTLYQSGKTGEGAAMVSAKEGVAISAATEEERHNTNGALVEEEKIVGAPV